MSSYEDYDAILRYEQLCGDIELLTRLLVPLTDLEDRTCLQGIIDQYKTKARLLFRTLPAVYRCAPDEPTF